MLYSVKEAIDSISNGEFVIILDDKSRENEGDFVLAAKHMNSAKLNFLLEFGKGLICTPLSRKRAIELNLEEMVKANNSKHQTAFTVSIDIDNGSSGISATDRALTINALADKDVTAEKFVRPGHIFPLIANDAGVLGRNGHTEASIDLVKMAGAGDVAVICEILNAQGEIASEEEIIALAQKFSIPVITINQLICFRIMNEPCLEYSGEFELQTDCYGPFIVNVIRDLENKEHIVIKSKTISKNPLVRIHSECFTGDILSSSHCDCGEQLHRSLEMISSEGGVVIYLKQEGRGIGLFNKIKTYQIQKNGKNTFEANRELGFQDDGRKYYVAARILKDYGINDIRIMTNNPEKIEHLKEAGINIAERIALDATVGEFNIEYLRAKQLFTKHQFNNQIFNQ
jgi:3,4-dihydroxy 2-butanone 4-phosphate synthase/GTP cyclohydrolase II